MLGAVKHMVGSGTLLFPGRARQRLRVAALGALLLGAGVLPRSAAGTVPLEARPEDFRAVINGAKERVFPSVVYLRCVLENFEMGKRICHTVGGSGVIISADGEVVTNWHVVNNALEVRCLLNDGRAFDAKVVGVDKDTDLALLRLNLPEGVSLPPAEFGDSAGLQEGDFVMALGAPWGLNRSISFGIVACARRYLPETSEYNTWIQTDASISPGNSGGPLVDTAGRIVGINARGATQGGDMGFAIPAQTAQVVLARLRAGGDAGWSWTGLQLQPLRDFQRNTYFPGEAGVIVAGLDEGSPAGEAGFRAHDRLLSLGGADMTARMEEDLPDLRRRLALLPEGVEVSAVVQRGAEEVTLRFKPRNKGRVLGEEFECGRWDFTVKTINQFEVPDLHFLRAEGVYVRGVRAPGNAMGTGLQPRDIVLSVNGLDVRNLDDVRRLHAQSLAALERGGARRVVLRVQRGGQAMQVVVDLSRDFSRGD